MMPSANREYKWKGRIEQAKGTDSASRYEETEVPFVHHLGRARIAGNWKLRSRIYKRIWGWNFRFGSQQGISVEVTGMNETKHGIVSAE